MLDINYLLQNTVKQCTITAIDAYILDPSLQL